MLLNPAKLQSIQINGINFHTNNNYYANNCYLFLAFNYEPQKVLESKEGILCYQTNDSYSNQGSQISWFIDPFVNDNVIVNFLKECARTQKRNLKDSIYEY